METVSLWNRYMTCYDFVNTVDSYKRNMEDILSHLPTLRDIRVLDAGSGTGNLSILMKQRGAHVSSCDFSAAAVEIHKAKDAQADATIASLEDSLPYETSTFDAVCCASVLFALSEKGCRNAASEFYRVLKPGGRLVITVAAMETRPSKLAQLHLRELTKNRGRLMGWLRWLLDFPALSKVMYYCNALSTLPDWQGFHCFSEKELATLVTTAGLSAVSMGRTYGGAFHIVCAQKPW